MGILNNALLYYDFVMYITVTAYDRLNTKQFEHIHNVPE